MANASNYYREQLLGEWRGVAFAFPGTTYLALHTADPGLDGSGAEVSGGAYARVAITSNTTNWGAPSDAGGAEAITNLVDLTFPTPAGADWGVVTHWGLWDAASGGNLLISGELTVSREVLDGDIAPVVPASALTITAA